MLKQTLLFCTCAALTYSTGTASEPAKKAKKENQGEIVLVKSKPLETDEDAKILHRIKKKHEDEQMQLLSTNEQGKGKDAVKEIELIASNAKAEEQERRDEADERDDTVQLAGCVETGKCSPEAVKRHREAYEKRRQETTTETQKNSPNEHIV